MHRSAVLQRSNRYLVLIAAVAIAALAAPSAMAAQDQWYSIPGQGGATGSAIMDSASLGYWTSSARGRVTIRPNGGCAKVQYAPFAVLAADGGWNSLGQVCGSATQSWSDSFHLAYVGFKFRICKNGNCGSNRYIYF